MLLAVTPGEPAGIGPEILLRLHRDHPEFQLLAIADPSLLRQTADSLSIDTPIVEWSPEAEIRPGEMACHPVRMGRPVSPGQPDPGNAAYVLETLKQGCQLVRAGHAAALVTGPVHKGIINRAGIHFSGHTEFLAELSGAGQVVMMLAAPGLRVSLVTTHLPLREVPDAISPQKLEAVIRITERALRRQFGIPRPRLQVLGLNPHAGEGGHLGHEDDQIIAPVIGRLQAAGMDLDGPVPADTAFNAARMAQCDAVVAMYHDQGLPVLKHVGFGQSVNITLGLPFVRTSVDHGTALDLAGSGSADTGSLHQALLTAQTMAGRH